VSRIVVVNHVATDGPFAEGKGHLGGAWVIKSPDIDADLG
jgi:hypothetical protein